jgi:hypothetical protein
MHYSTIKPVLKKHEILIDRGSLKIKRKFAFLLEKGDIILINRNLEVNEEVEVVVDYTYTEKSKRPKETINIFKIEELIKE